jgi:hypothetical protein
VIVKKIPARPSARNVTTERATHARHLVDYLALPEKASAYKDYMVDYMLGQKLGNTSLERLFHIGVRGFVSDTIEGQRAEMIAVAQAASRSRNPVDHWLLSWREGEYPTPEQVDATVAMFVEHLGVAAQPCIYACHGDTMNRHVHLALNRYDATNRRMIEINDGFTLEAAHQAVALIVDRLGWSAEADQRYHVVDGRAVLTPAALARVEAGIEALRPEAAAFENRTGYSSAQRIAQVEALPLIDAARSWAELHATLAARGIRYEPTGTNGAAIVVEDDGVKASFVHRRITRGALAKRLGPFAPRDAEVAITPREPERDRLPHAFRADEYRAQCEAWREWQARRKAARTIARRDNPTRAALRAAAKQRVKAAETPPPRPAPDLESFYYDHDERVFAERWRHRRKAGAFPALTGLLSQDAPAPDLIDGYRAHRCVEGVRYALPDGPTAFIDSGDRIDVVLTDDVTVLAALRLAVNKFDGRITVSGSAAFQERVYAVALANGLSDAVDDPAFVARQEAAARAQARRSPAVPIVLPPDAIRSKGPRPAAEPDTTSVQNRGITAQAKAIGRSSPPGAVSSKGPRAKPEGDVATASTHVAIPVPQADPERAATIAALVRELEGAAHLPLIPHAACEAQAASRFTIDLNLGDPLDARFRVFRPASHLEDDPAVQAAYGRQHRHTMEIAEQVLRGVTFDERRRVRAGIFDDLEPAGAGLAHALTLMRASGELAELLERAEAHWAQSDAIERDRVSTAGRSSEPEAQVEKLIALTRIGEQTYVVDAGPDDHGAKRHERGKGR